MLSFAGVSLWREKEMVVSEVVRRAARALPTPFLIMDLSIVRENYRRLAESLPDSLIYYAVKANAHPRILEVLRDEGSYFDVASRGEIEKVLALGVDPQKMSFGNTIKRGEDIAFAYSLGIDLFAADAEMELEKIARNAPRSEVYLRIAMDSADSGWPLSRKFGTDPEHVVELARYAVKLGLCPVGVSFHVGSQSYNPNRWDVAIEKAAWVFKKVKEFGVNMWLLNIGGGMPVHHTKPVPTVEEIAEVIKSSIEKHLWFVDHLQLMVEPGRSMVGDAGIMVSRVLLRGKKPSAGQEWVYLDAGVFHGLMETIEDFRYEVVVDGKENSPKKRFVLAGPTCDSVDKIYESIELPEDIDYDDVVYFINAGAYTTEYNTRFNGIEPPNVIFTDDVERMLELTELTTEVKEEIVE